MRIMLLSMIGVFVFVTHTCAYADIRHFRNAVGLELLIIFVVFLIVLVISYLYYQSAAQNLKRATQTTKRQQQKFRGDSEDNLHADSQSAKGEMIFTSIKFKTACTATEKIGGFYTTVPWKFILLTITTVGLYEVYWFYKNWQYIKKQSNVSLNPIFRALMAPYFASSLFERVAKQPDGNLHFNPNLPTTLYILSCIAFSLPSFWSLLGFFSLVPLLLVQLSMSEQNLNAGVAAYTSTRISMKHVIVIVLVWVFVIMLLLFFLRSILFLLQLLYP